MSTIKSYEKALEIGLIDRFGGLDEAVAAAANLAGLESYRTVDYPVQKDPVTKLMEELTGETLDVSAKVLQANLGEYYEQYNQLKTLREMKGVQARMPFNLEIE